MRSPETGLRILALVSFAAVIIAYFWFVDAYAVNTIWLDQWSDLTLIEHAYSGHLAVSALWAQHSDNRILFPNLMVLLLAKTTGFNVIYEEFLSAITLVITTAILIVGHRRRSTRIHWIFYLPVAILTPVFRARTNDGAPLGVGLICFGLLFALSITSGRAAPDIVAASASRYATYDMLTLVGCYFIVLARGRAALGDSRTERVPWWTSVGIVGVAVSLTLILGTLNGLDDAGAWQNAQIQGARVIVNIQRAPDSMVARVVDVAPFEVPNTRQLVAFARHNGLTLFASPATMDRYVSAGLPSDANSLMNNVAYPPDGANVLSFVQWQNTLWGFQFAWYLVLLALSAALVLCDSPRWNWLVIAAAIGAALVGSYSSVQGLLIWPAGLAVLLLRRRRLPFLLVWIAAAGATTAIYFVNYSSQWAGTNTYGLHHSVQGLRFFFFSMGNVIGAHSGNVVTMVVVLGVFIVLTSLWLIFSTTKRLRCHDMGSWICALPHRKCAAARMATRPIQESAAATRRGMEVAQRLPTATNPPTANSQARVNGDVYATKVPAPEDDATEIQKEAVALTASRSPSLKRTDRRGKTMSATSARTGYTR
jgi:hypothetical protein